MSNPLHLLIVEDSESDAAMLVRILSKAGYDVQIERVEDAAQMETALEKQLWDVVISDYSLPQFDAPAALVVLQQSGLDIPFIVVSGTVGEATAVAMMKAGAHDYLMKDNLTRLAPAVAREIREAQSRRERLWAEKQLKETERLAQATIDALTAHLCVLDQEGTILTVNRAWREFAETNPPVPANYGLGANYLDVCDRAGGPNAAEATPFAAGIRAVLEGKVERFSLEYPCHAPWEARWFMGLVTRFPGDGPLRLVVSHQNITERKQAEEALEVSLERLSSIFRVAPIGIGMAINRIIKEVNQCMLEITGYSRAELIEQNACLLYATDEEFERVGREKYAQLREQGIGVIETKWQRKDGSVRDILLSSTRLNADDESAGVTFTALDITARKKADESLRRSEERYRTVADYTYDWEYWVGPDEQWLYCSPSCERITGYPAKYFLDKPAFFGEIVHPDDRLLLTHHLAEAKNPPQVENVDFRIIHRDGVIRWLNHVCQPVWDQDGQWLGRRASNRDITERKQAEDILRASEIRFSTIFHASPVAIAITRFADNQFVDVNKAWQAMTGYTYTEVIGHTPFDLNLWAKPEQREALIKTLGAHGLAREEVQLRCQSGQIVHVLMSVDLIKLADEPYLLTMAQDITHRKQLEAENERLTAQFYQAQKMESIGQLAGGIAHDFNNLLVPVIGYTELGMLKLSPDSPLYADLKRVKEAGDRAASLTRQILAFSRQQMLEMKLLDLNQVISDFEPMLRRLIGEDIDLQLRLAANLLSLKADKGQLEQVLLNLAVNARDAMPDGGVLIIETALVILDKAYVARHPDMQPGPHALLTVNDTGQGMDAATLQRIFEPFFTTKGQGKGTGLGLATVFGIIKQHEGNIWVYSEPGLGTSFKIYLPLVAAPTDAVEPEQLETGTLEGQETVLLVEDEASVRQLTGDTLALYGYRVMAAAEPEKGLALATAHQGPIHLLLSDVVMPQMRGPELAKRLVALHPEIKVLYMSGYTDQTIAHHGVLGPGQFFLQKPFNLHDLMRKVRQVLDSAST